MIYQVLAMPYLKKQVKKDKNKAREFETWKKQAKEKTNDMKKGKLTEKEVYQWISRNKSE